MIGTEQVAKALDTFKGYASRRSAAERRAGEEGLPGGQGDGKCGLLQGTLLRQGRRVTMSLSKGPIRGTYYVSAGTRIGRGSASGRPSAALRPRYRKRMGDGLLAPDGGRAEHDADVLLRALPQRQGTTSSATSSRLTSRT